MVSNSHYAADGAMSPTTMHSLDESQLLGFGTTLSREGLSKFTFQESYWSFSAVLRKRNRSLGGQNRFHFFVFPLRNHSWVSFQGFSESYNDAFELVIGKRESSILKTSTKCTIHGHNSRIESADCCRSVLQR